MHSHVAATVLAAATGISIVQAHGYVASWNIGGVDYRGFDQQYQSDASQLDDFIAWSTTASDNGFVAPSAYGDADIICHRGAKNGVLNNATVEAGGSITATWNTWPESHHGPVIDYLAPADDPTTVDKTSLKFFKIQEVGLVSGPAPGTWGSDKIISNNLGHEIKIPANLKPGKYVLRHEIIALHSASNADGAQNYPQCVNIQVTGSGSEQPEGTLGTALYSADDEGIKFNIYNALDSYPIPGPKLAFSTASKREEPARKHARDFQSFVQSVNNFFSGRQDKTTEETKEDGN
jgi:lytic cellulose monooxygenase (C1-hydroxylating)